MDVPSPGTGLWPPAAFRAAAAVVHHASEAKTASGAGAAAWTLRRRHHVSQRAVSCNHGASSMGTGAFISWLPFWKGCKQARQQPGRPGCASQLPCDLDRASKTCYGKRQPGVLHNKGLSRMPGHPWVTRDTFHFCPGPFETKEYKRHLCTTTARPPHRSARSRDILQRLKTPKLQAGNSSLQHQTPTASRPAGPC